MQPSQNAKYIHALRFRWLTPLYDAVVGLSTRERTFKKALIQQASFQSGQKVLDLGCGTGTLSIWIKQMYPKIEVVGLDGDPEILKLARRKSHQADASIQFDEGFSTRLPYPENHFDRIVSTLFFHHLTLSDKQRTIAEVLRVLKPGGQLHVADWGKASNALMRGLFFFIQILDSFETTRDNIQGRLPQLFEKAGFIEVSCVRTFSTAFGTIALYKASKPDLVRARGRSHA